MTKVVRPSISWLRPAWIMASDSESSELVASSSIRNARALPAMRAQSTAAGAGQPESFTPRSPQWSRRHPDIVRQLIHSSCAAGKQKLLHGGIGPRKRMFSRMVPSKRNESCSTTPKLGAEKCPGPPLQGLRCQPSRGPRTAVWNAQRRLMIVDLPEPTTPPARSQSLLPQESLRREGQVFPDHKQTRHCQSAPYP